MSSHAGFPCRGQVPRHRSAKAYVVGRDALFPVDLATGKVGKPLLSSAYPVAVAVSPDGRTAYAGTTGAGDSVVPINVATNAAGKPIATPAGAEAIAFSPDGRTAYAAGIGGVTPISLGTCTVGRVIATPALELLGVLAITPDGRTAYLPGYLESAEGQPGFLRIDLARGIAGKFLPVPGMDAAAVAPDGRMAYVAGGPFVIPISLVTGKVGKPIKMPVLGGGSIAITPDGRTAYVGNVKPEAPDAGIVVPVDLAAGTAEKPIHVPNYPYSLTEIAITANGRTAYAVSQGKVTPINLTTRKAARPITMTAGAYFIALTS